MRDPAIISSENISSEPPSTSASAVRPNEEGSLLLPSTGTPQVIVALSVEPVVVKEIKVFGNFENFV